MQFISLNLAPLIEANALATIGRENLADLTIYYKKMFPQMMNRQIEPFSSWPDFEEIQFIAGQFESMGVDLDETFDELIAAGSGVGTGASGANGGENSHMTPKSSGKFSSSKKWQRQRKISAESEQKEKFVSDSIEKIPSPEPGSLPSPAESTPQCPVDLTPLHNLSPNWANQLPERMQAVAKDLRTIMEEQVENQLPVRMQAVAKDLRKIMEVQVDKVERPKSYFDRKRDEKFTPENIPHRPIQPW